MQPRLNIAIKACRSVSELIVQLYLTKNQDELILSKGINEYLYSHIVNVIMDAYPFGETDILGPSPLNFIPDNIKDKNTCKVNNIFDYEEKYIWVINPIDCYENFINKLPLFNVSITIFHKRCAYATVIFNPIKDEMTTAIKGNGAMQENKKIRHTKNHEKRLLYSIKSSAIEDKLRAYIDGESRNIGSPSTEFAYLSSGSLDLIIYPSIDILDSAAGILLCKESGILISDIEGNDDIYNSTSIIAAKSWLHSKILKLLN
tara:strand:- start:273 stop:1052 length:780 start_codon:yes stop_codon:yes gene_type:complete